jgi:hypothetical protein
MGFFLSIIAALIGLISAVCFLQVVIHAFRRSTGTGILVLCVPFYNFVYAFKQFEHRNKNWILACWLGGVGLLVLLKLAVDTPALKPRLLPTGRG